MSDLKVVSDPAVADASEQGRPSVPVSAGDAALNRRDLDMIKRDLITVRKDYREIRDNLVILAHQHSRTPSRGFFVTFGAIWLIVLLGLLLLQPHLASLSDRVASYLQHRS